MHTRTRSECVWLSDYSLGDLLATFKGNSQLQLSTVTLFAASTLMEFDFSKSECSHRLIGYWTADESPS